MFIGSVRVLFSTVEAKFSWSRETYQITTDKQNTTGFERRERARASIHSQEIEEINPKDFRVFKFIRERGRSRSMTPRKNKKNKAKYPEKK